MPQTLSAFRAVLFDFDGTLADSYDAIAASVNYIRSRHGLGPLTVDEVRRHVGRGPIYLMQQTVPGANVEAAVACYRTHHPTVMIEGTRFFPGALESLQALHQAGKMLGLCSNKPRLFSHELLRFYGILPLFQEVIGPEDVVRPKPAPDVIQLALTRMGITPAEALYVGDMAVDIQTARAAGVQVWVVPTGSEERLALEKAKPDRLLEDLRELLQLCGN